MLSCKQRKNVGAKEHTDISMDGKKSLLFNYPENSKAILIIKYVFHFSLQLLCRNSVRSENYLAILTQDASREECRSLRKVYVIVVRL